MGVVGGGSIRRFTSPDERAFYPGVGGWWVCLYLCLTHGKTVEGHNKGQPTVLVPTCICPCACYCLLLPASVPAPATVCYCLPLPAAACLCPCACYCLLLPSAPSLLGHSLPPRHAPFRPATACYCLPLQILCRATSCPPSCTPLSWRRARRPSTSIQVSWMSTSQTYSRVRG